MNDPGADVQLKPADEIAAVFTEAGVRPGDTVIGYCHIGQQATAMLLAARTLGYRVVLYDGSFEDWSRRDLPVDTPVDEIELIRIARLHATVRPTFQFRRGPWARIDRSGSAPSTQCTSPFAPFLS